MEIIPEDEARRLVSRPKGGSGSRVPYLSIEVDDLDTALQRMKKAKVAIEYGPADEPWGVRRFYVRDPFGRLINILMHGSAVGR